MKFRTEIPIEPFATKIDYHNRIFALGSCFAEQIAQRLAQAKFQVVCNPSGVLFNPLSIATALRSYADPQLPLRAPQQRLDGTWFSYDLHSAYDGASAAEVLDNGTAARLAGGQALARADRLLLTFGSAWLYEQGGEVVANCHKMPAMEFTRRRATVAEIVALYGELFEGILADREVILTVSPVRHIGQGLHENALSKAILLLAAEELCRDYKQVHYFPAYELLMDDLRDYRFYADDMAHPSTQAVSYIWEQFSQAALSLHAQQLLPRIARITAAAAHHPLAIDSQAYHDFCRTQIAAIESLPEIDFEAERAYFERYLE